MLSLASLTVVIGGMAAINENARNAIGQMLAGKSPIAVRIPDLRVVHLSRFSDVLGLPSGTETAIVGFVAAAFILFLLMFRT
jgi:hypothetical protein